jgi:small-conductance mechanosensitive channel
MGAWFEVLGEPFRAFMDSVYAYLPRVAAAAAVLLVGWLVAKGLRFAVSRVLDRIGAFLRARTGEEPESKAGRAAERAVETLVFWLVFLVAAGAAAEVLGLSSVTGGLASFAQYIPSLIGSVVVLFGGLVGANLTAAWVRGAAQRAGVAYGDAIAQVAKVGILMLAGVVALSEIGIDSTLLVVALGILLASFLGAAALAFGLGARSTVANIIACHYVQRNYRVNQRITVGPHEGRILEIRPTGVLLDTPEGVAYVPGSTFSDTSTILHAEEAE